MTVHREQPIDGPKVRRLRNKKWMNQGDLSEETGVAVDTISRIEKGHRPYPRRSTIFALAKALEVKPDELLMPEGAKLSDPLTLPDEAPRDDSERREDRRTG